VVRGAAADGVLLQRYDPRQMIRMLFRNNAKVVSVIAVRPVAAAGGQRGLVIALRLGHQVAEVVVTAGNTLAQSESLLF
jgi:hypothetical protein